jgi:hypothetical protein
VRITFEESNSDWTRAHRANQKKKQKKKKKHEVAKAWIGDLFEDKVAGRVHDRAMNRRRRAFYIVAQAAHIRRLVAGVSHFSRSSCGKLLTAIIISSANAA